MYILLQGAFRYETVCCLFTPDMSYARYCRHCAREAPVRQPAGAEAEASDQKERHADHQIQD